LSAACISAGVLIGDIKTPRLSKLTRWVAFASEVSAYDASQRFAFISGSPRASIPPTLERPRLYREAKALFEELNASPALSFDGR
jgi:hypothetical protein